MTKPNIQIHNIETDEITIREMTDEEFAHYQLVQDNFQTQQVELEAKAQAKAALLERLGITADEAKLLLS